jgi:hypothetical protein
MWTVLARMDVTASGVVRWWCRCACGREAVVQAGNLVRSKSTKCRQCSNSREFSRRWNPDA